MNNYSWLEQKLHELALSSQFMREITFEFENSKISTFNGKNNHVFITGLARSGTTILLWVTTIGIVASPSAVLIFITSTS